MINYRNQVVQEDLKGLITDIDNWITLKNKTVLVAGATGMLASYFSFVLFYLNERYDFNIQILLLARHKEKIKKVFGDNANNTKLFIQDICDKIDYSEKIDYIFHAAGSASPYHIINNPTGIIKANTIGTINILETAKRTGKPKIIFTSTREIYGKIENKKQIAETDMGVLDPLQSRSCYPESKRISETLLKSYADQFSIPFINLRIAHSYGPGMEINNDGRVMSDFIYDAVHQKNIILKSEGLAERAFCYITDAISAIFTALLKGKENNAYNIANETEAIKIIDLAQLIQDCAKNGKDIEKQIDKASFKGYTNYNRTSLNTQKIESLGWQPKINLKEGIKKTLSSFNK